MTAPISPLGIDILRAIFNFDSGARSEKEYNYVKSAAGRIYLDLSVLFQYKRLRHGFASFLKNADALMSEALTELINRPDFETNIQKNKSAGKALRKFMLPIAAKAINNLIFKKPEGTIESVNTYIDNRISKTSEKLNNAKHGTQRLDVIYEIASFHEDFQNLLPKMAPAMIIFKALEALEQKLLGTHKYSDIIVKGLEGNITTEM
jgi:pyruvate,water dikinase